MCLKHRWGVWREGNYNKYPYVLPKKEERECEKCHESERRDLPSLERRVFFLQKDGLTEHEIAEMLERLKGSYGLMRYDYTIRRLLEEVREGRK